jgi:hypothetical protein
VIESSDTTVPPQHCGAGDDVSMSNSFSANESLHPVMSVRGWVFRLIARECTEDEFMAQVRNLEKADSEVAWEVLGLLDQQRRRKHLDEFVFQRVKRRLQQHCLRYGVDDSAPPEPTPEPEPVAHVPAAQVTERPLALGDVQKARTPAVPEIPLMIASTPASKTRRPSPLLWMRQGAQVTAAFSLLAAIAFIGYQLLGMDTAQSSGNGYAAADTTWAPLSLPSNIPSHGFLSAGFGIPSHITPRLGDGATENTTQGDVLDLPRPLVRVDGNQSVAKIWVRRRGDLRGPVTFYWWTETGSAQVMRDFTQIMRRWEVIGDGEAGIELRVPLTGRALRTGTLTFYVKIDRTRSGALLGRRTLAQIEILPPRAQAVAANSERQAE